MKNFILIEPTVDIRIRIRGCQNSHIRIRGCGKSDIRPITNLYIFVVHLYLYIFSGWLAEHRRYRCRGVWLLRVITRLADWLLDPAVFALRVYME